MEQFEGIDTHSVYTEYLKIITNCFHKNDHDPTIPGKPSGAIIIISNSTCLEMNSSANLYISRRIHLAARNRKPSLKLDHMEMGYLI